MSGKIVRRPDFAGGGITAEEKAAMDEIAQKWVKRAFRTDPIEPEKITQAIHGLYEVAGLEQPRVVIVPSPLVMAYAYGAAAAIWHSHGKVDVKSATEVAVKVATMADAWDAVRATTGGAVRDATMVATWDAVGTATRHAIRSAIWKATCDAVATATGGAAEAAPGAVNGAYMACKEVAGDFGLKCAKRWTNAYQGGNMTAYTAAYYEACRDVLGLKLPEFEPYHWWEQAAIHGGFRVMHEKFCIVSDFPKVIHTDDNNQPHRDDGPALLWRDGFSAYYWHGTMVPHEWIEERESLSPETVLAAENVEQRAAGMEIVGPRMLDGLKHEIIDSDPDPARGDLIRVWLPDLPNPALYLHFECPRNGPMMEGVDESALEEITLLHAHAWHANVPVQFFNYPNQRT